MQQLVHIEEHVKNYRPQILVLSGLPSSRPPLIDFAYLICKQLSLMVCGHVVSQPINQRTRAALTHRMYKWFQAHKIKAFYSLVDNSGFKGKKNKSPFAEFQANQTSHLFRFRGSHVTDATQRNRQDET